MNHIDQKIERALQNVTFSQSAKYRVKSKISSAVQKPQGHLHKKLSAAAVFSITLAALLVVSVAAIGGLSYFKAIYGDEAETLNRRQHIAESVGQAFGTVVTDGWTDRKSTRLNSSHTATSRMPSSA